VEYNSLITKDDLENPATQKRLSEMGAESRFCLYEKVLDFNKKSRLASGDFKFFPNLATLYDFARTHFR
jgi:hypothetical protein